MKILYFGALKEKNPIYDFASELPLTVGQLRLKLNQQTSDIDFLDAKTLCAVNQEIVKDNITINADDEVAFFPPMTGG